LTPVVNFINILQAAFAPVFLRQYFCAQKLQSLTVTREKLPKTLLCQKVSSKMSWRTLAKQEVLLRIGPLAKLGR